MIFAPIAPLSRTAEAAPAASPAEPKTAARADAAFSSALDAVQRSDAARGHQSGVADDLEQFEGFVLRSFMESMLPKEDSSFFGSGTAGGIWRSMMAERLGEELAAGGGVGIADMLRQTPAKAPSTDDAPPPGAR